MSREKPVQPEGFEGVEDARKCELEWLCEVKEELLAFCKVLTPPSGNQNNLERYYLLKEKVC